MDVSIIIPAYNRLWALPKAVASCRNTKCQTEIIVIDDGSTDGTWQWLQQQSGLVILHQQNWGKCWAVNNAFKICKGKYVRFLDSDDTLADNAIDEQFEIAESTGSDIIVSGYLLVDEDSNILGKQPWVTCDDYIAQQLGECDSSHYSAYLFKKTFIDDVPHRPDYAYRDDRLFVLETALKHPKVAIHRGFALLHTSHKKTKMQQTSGLQKAAQNYQHLNIYKHIFSQLAQAGELTERRIKASEDVLWTLCGWIARDNVQDAVNLLKWIKELDPQFKIPGKGIIGLLQLGLGFKITHKLLKIIKDIGL